MNLNECPERQLNNYMTDDYLFIVNQEHNDINVIVKIASIKKSTDSNNVEY